MAEFHVKANGDDKNTGADGDNAIASARYALEYAKANAGTTLVFHNDDVHRLTRISPTSPTNLDVQSIDAVTDIFPNDFAASFPQITSSHDLSQGVSRGNYLSNGDFEQIAATDNIVDWAKVVGSEVLEKETTIVPTAGDVSLKVTSAADTFQAVSQSVYLPKNCTFKLTATVRQNTTSPARVVIVSIRDVPAASGSDYWDFANGTGWIAQGADSRLETTTGQAGTWVTLDSSLENNIVTQTSGEHEFVIADNANANTEYYCGNISLTNVTEPTYDWKDDATSGVYYLPYMHFQPRTVVLDTETNWTANGIDAFQSHAANMEFVDTIDKCRANESTAFWSSGDDRLYIHPPAGTDMATSHVEAYPLGIVIDLDEDITMSSLAIMGSTPVGSASGNSIPNFCVLSRIKTRHAAAGMSFNEGRIHRYLCHDKWQRWASEGTTTRGGLLVLGNSTVYDFGGLIEYSTEDGYQSAFGGKLYCYYSVFRDGVSTAASVSPNGSQHGFKSDTSANTQAVFRNCTALRAQGAGILIPNISGTGGVATVEECISADNGGFDYSFSGTNGTRTVNQNLGGDYTQISGASDWTGGTNNQSVADGDITSVDVNQDGSLKSTFTAAIGTGTRSTYTDPDSVSTVVPCSNQEPPPEYDVDKGAFQSTFSSGHPSKRFTG